MVIKFKTIVSETLTDYCIASLDLTTLLLIGLAIRISSFISPLKLITLNVCTSKCASFKFEWLSLKYHTAKLND
jgi:hypothetical protein